jgi:uncharacterized membrane protein
MRPQCCPFCKQSESALETESALEILKKRYAKGEINKEQVDWSLS